MDNNSKKIAMKTVSAKITPAVKAELEEKAKKGGMIISDYLRMLIEQAGIEVNQDNTMEPAPEKDIIIESHNNTYYQSHLIVNQLQEIKEKQDLILKNITDEKSKRFYAIMFGALILVFGCASLLTD